jgi:hypothetical protein
MVDVKLPAIHQGVWGRVSVNPLIFNLESRGNGQLYALSILSPAEEPPVPIVTEARWVSQLVWMFVRNKKFLAPTRNQNTMPQSASPYCSHYSAWVFLLI